MTDNKPLNQKKRRLSKKEKLLRHAMRVARKSIKKRKRERARTKK